MKKNVIINDDIILITPILSSYFFSKYSGSVRTLVATLPFNLKLPEPPSGSFASSNVDNLVILLSSPSYILMFWDEFPSSINESKLSLALTFPPPFDSVLTLVTSMLDISEKVLNAFSSYKLREGLKLVQKLSKSMEFHIRQTTGFNKKIKPKSFNQIW